MRLLIIEDDPGIARLVTAILGEEGYEVDHASSGETGRALAMHDDYAGILLDLTLGDIHGVTILRELRRSGVATPVLILTAEASESVLVQALDAGADEYVVKPVRSRELSARVRALVRRRVRAIPASELTIGTLTLDRVERRALVRGNALNLSPKEFTLLDYFMRSVGEVATRPALLENVWDMRFDPGSNIVDVHVTRLRRKLENAEAPVRIETRRGTGFVLVPEPIDPLVPTAALRGR